MGRRGSGSNPMSEWETTYSRLRRATETYREELVLRLGAEAGLQPSEMSVLRPADVSDRPHRPADLYSLTVPTDGRTTYLSAAVEHDFRKYVGVNDVDETDRVFPVTPRRLQMLVSTVGERAAEKTGQDELADISSRDLRRFFARRLLDDGVHPSVVMKVGGWNSLESLDPFVAEPSAPDVVAALAEDRTVQPHPEPGTDRRLTAVLELADEVSDALVGATTKDGLEETLCERLGGSSVYRFALVAPTDPGTRTSRTVVGLDETVSSEFLDGLDGSSPGDEEIRAVRTANTDLSSRQRPVAVTSVPLVHGETSFGRLYLGTSPGAVSDRERALLASLGRQVGATLAAVERKKLLVADTVTQLRFVCSDETDVFVRLSATLGCTCSLRGVAPIEDRSLLCFLAVSDVPTEQAFDELDTAPEISNVRLIRDRGENSLLEVVLSGDSLLTAVTARDGTVSEFTADDGAARFAVELANEVPLRTVVSELTDAYPSTELRSKREVERTPQHSTDFRDSVETQLTDKQYSALRAAYLAGYFEWPRESTAEDLADSIDVSSPTLHQHLRTAQQKLLTSFFDDGE
ncbi:bacterio-opsin activator domain-containing protein [Haloferax sp. YSSS75]|uniref:bacterio-opsin activator domain-containing protein n=1 Tax=Haloferax sp. YSSS75 TaxID=3388564 RepID=UPI00398CA2D1